jgi:hypothetical protein
MARTVGKGGAFFRAIQMVLKEHNPLNGLETPQQRQERLRKVAERRKGAEDGRGR